MERTGTQHDARICGRVPVASLGRIDLCRASFRGRYQMLEVWIGNIMSVPSCLCWDAHEECNVETYFPNQVKRFQNQYEGIFWVLVQFLPLSGRPIISHCYEFGLSEKQGATRHPIRMASIFYHISRKKKAVDKSDYSLS
jgi:hypothetical protein